MREEYDIKNLNPRRNPYADKLKKQITIRLNVGTIEYFKKQAEETGISYQNLINMYLTRSNSDKSVSTHAIGMAL